MNKHDIAQYLEKIYNVPVLHVRTELRVKDIYANSVESKLCARYFTVFQPPYHLQTKSSWILPD
jgi:hypothetical protein